MGIKGMRWNVEKRVKKIYEYEEDMKKTMKEELEDLYDIFKVDSKPVIAVKEL